MRKIGQRVEVRRLVRLLLEGLHGRHLIETTLRAGLHLQQRHEPWEAACILGQ